MPRRTASSRAFPPPHPPQIPLPDGAVAQLNGRALEVRDPEGRLLVRYVDGTAEISAPSGDLRLRAPEGRVVVESGLDIELTAARDLVHRAGRQLELSAAQGTGDPQVRIDHAATTVKSDRLEVQAVSTMAVLGAVTLLARTLNTTADHLTSAASCYEVMADRLVERSRETLVEVADLAESRIGRVRTFIRDAFSLASRRTVMTSTEETSIDGKRVLLG